MSGFNITLNNVKYYVKFVEEPRKITCTIFSEGNDVIFNNQTFQGVAKCHPDDEYSIYKGHEMAFERALEKHNKTYARNLNNFMTRRLTVGMRNMNGLIFKFKKHINNQDWITEKK